jgi:putative ATP-dependent endonuclease of the OLD family
VKVRRVSVSNFRGVRSGSVLLDTRSLLVGGNAVGKSTVCEALDLVLGLERLYRRPVIDEYDFHQALYRGGEPGGAGSPPEVRIEVVLTDLSAEAQRRFAGHVRPWSAEMNDFAPPADIAGTDPGVTPAAGDAGGEDADLAAGEWCLPVVFLGRFNPDEDDFEGSTFFAHPQRAEGDYDPEELGGGLAPFRREDKRYCGYLYLRPNRTGSRALSFGRGSLIDTIVRLESDQAGSLWTSALGQLDGIDLAASTPGFGKIRAEVLARVRKFLAVPDDDTAMGVRPSDLTREHLREVLRMFIAARPGVYPVPFSRLSTGALNVLVFALLTYIADLRGPGSVIFAMEEPEIALPPHTQRRMVDFVTKTMGQAIVTSHSPYVIERFTPEEIVVLTRDDTGTLFSSTIALGGHVRSRNYRAQRRQFAEAILANGVLVAEGGTEVAVYLAVADVLDAAGTPGYEHPDVAGLTVFDAGSDSSVPKYGPVFAAMGKSVFGTHDTMKTPYTAEQEKQAESFTIHHQIPYLGMEDLLATEVGPVVLRRFLSAVATRDDYPHEAGKLAEGAGDERVAALVKDVLKARKATEYAPLLIAECSAAELPPTLVALMLGINAYLTAKATATAAEPEAQAGPADGDQPAAGGPDEE